MMANKHNFKSNRWFSFVEGTSQHRHSHNYEETCISIINLMEMAYAMGKRDGEEKNENSNRDRWERLSELNSPGKYKAP